MASFRSEETDTPTDQGWRSLTSFCGKARPPIERPSPSYHPLIFHSLDVAAVGQALLSRRSDLAAGLAAALGLEAEATTALLVRLLPLHDVGKFAPRGPGDQHNRHRRKYQGGSILHGRGTTAICSQGGG
jgi:hypothetical protein